MTTKRTGLRIATLTAAIAILATPVSAASAEPVFDATTIRGISEASAALAQQKGLNAYTSTKHIYYRTGYNGDTPGPGDYASVTVFFRANRSSFNATTRGGDYSVYGTDMSHESEAGLVQAQGVHSPRASVLGDGTWLTANLARSANPQIIPSGTNPRLAITNVQRDRRLAQAANLIQGYSVADYAARMVSTPDYLMPDAGSLTVTSVYNSPTGPETNYTWTLDSFVNPYGENCRDFQMNVVANEKGLMKRSQATMLCEDRYTKGGDYYLRINQQVLSYKASDVPGAPRPAALMASLR